MATPAIDKALSEKIHAPINDSGDSRSKGAQSSTNLEMDYGKGLGGAKPVQSVPTSDPRG